MKFLWLRVEVVVKCLFFLDVFNNVSCKRKIAAENICTVEFLLYGNSYCMVGFDSASVPVRVF